MRDDDRPISEVDEAEAGFAEHSKGWLAATQSRATSLAQLAIAETKLAAISVAMMAFFGALAAGFIIIAWALVVAAALQVLTTQDISLWLAMLLLAVAHGIAAAVLWRTATRLSDNLEFKVTRGELASVKEAL